MRHRPPSEGHASDTREALGFPLRGVDLDLQSSHPSLGALEGCLRMLLRPRPKYRIVRPVGGALNRRVFDLPGLLVGALTGALKFEPGREAAALAST